MVNKKKTPYRKQRGNGHTKKPKLCNYIRARDLD